MFTYFFSLVQKQTNHDFYEKMTQLQQQDQALLVARPLLGCLGNTYTIKVQNVT